MVWQRRREVFVGNREEKRERKGVRSKRSAFERKSSTRVTTKPEVHLSIYA
jgi:hypothetical protein